jgi:hypothetical protein
MDINPHYKGGLQHPTVGTPLADDQFPVLGPADPAERTGEKQPIEAPAVHGFRIDYLLNHEPRSHRLTLPMAHLSTQEATLHLLALHFGDAENSLLMPNGEASAEQILAQAAVMGITEVHAAVE